MAKSAAESLATNNATRPLAGLLRLDDLAPQAPDTLRDTISLGIRLTQDGNALAEVTWLVGKPGLAAQANVCGQRLPLLENIGQQLSAWFTDPGNAFQLPLAAPRSPFQAKLRQALSATRPGDTITYGDLAKQLHSAPRAVGQALGSNPLPLIVPCHRIVSAGRNRLTGFNHASAGPMLMLKAWLLEREARA
jgi:methylated-DNA-[protein]-cysteine S-methyltransferase